MIAVDTNILVYAHRADSPWHAKAAELIRGLAEGSLGWAIPWPCIHEFLSIVTHPKIYRPPSPLVAATEQVAAWIESPSLNLLGESPEHWRTLREVIEAGRIVGPRVHDARVAALCIQHGVRELWSSDRDFGAMSGLTTRNPFLPLSRSTSRERR